MSKALYYILGISILVLLIIGIGVWFLPKYVPPAGCGNLSSQWARPNCVFLTESYSDSSIPTPTPSLYLGSFSQDSSPSVGGPCCTPMWYAFRYVRLSDGGYGPLSEWTTVPVQAGASTLPWATGAPNQSVGTATCMFNHPVIVTTQPLDLSYTDGYILNLHRQVGTPPGATSEGQIVGALINSGKTNPGFWYTSSWNDILYPTNTTGSRCIGC
jgi:hypothetical protein